MSQPSTLAPFSVLCHREFLAGLAYMMAQWDIPLPPSLTGVPSPRYDPNTSRWSFIEPSEIGSLRLAGQEVNLLKLWGLVMQQGGLRALEANGGWPAVCTEFGLPEEFPQVQANGSTSAAVMLGRIYFTILYPVEGLYEKCIQKRQRAPQTAARRMPMGQPGQMSWVSPGNVQPLSCLMQHGPAGMMGQPMLASMANTNGSHFSIETTRMPQTLHRGPGSLALNPQPSSHGVPLSSISQSALHPGMSHSADLNLLDGSIWGIKRKLDTGNTDAEPGRKATKLLRHSMLDELPLGLLDQVLRTTHRRKEMQTLQNNRAQMVIDFLNAVLSQSESTSLQFSKGRALITLYKLCKSSQLYPQLYVLQDISIEPIEDSGGFCDIHKGRHGNQELCLKVVRVFQKQDQDAMLKLFAKEAILWGQLDHPNILPFYGVYYLDETAKRICLVSPWMRKGNLVRYLRSNSLVPRLPLVYDIINGLGYLHREKIVHGDLKGANILVMDSGKACIADFGLSTVLDHSLPGADATSILVGVTCRWTAPELLNGAHTRPSCASDIWAFGGVCYQIFTRLLPFHEYVADGPVIGKILSGEFPPRVVADPRLDKVDDEMWDMMTRCWNFDHQSRPTCEELIRDFELKRFADNTGEDGHDERFALEKARFRNAMRKKSDVLIDSVSIVQVLNEL